MKKVHRYRLRTPAHGAALLASALALAAARCSSPANVPSSVTPHQPAKAIGSPELAQSLPWSVPDVLTAQLPNGLDLHVWPRDGADLLELRLLVLSGSSSDGHDVGVAALTGQLLKTGGTGSLSSREMLERLEGAGSRLAVLTTPDATVLSVSGLRDTFHASIAALAALAREPQLLETEFEKLKEREIERISGLAHSDADWMAAMALQRELFQSNATLHPYAAADARPSDLAELDRADCRRWYDANFSPRNAVLLAVGDIAIQELKAAAERAFGTWQGGEVAPPEFAHPRPPAHPKVSLVARSGSSHSELRVALFGPERRSRRWPALSVAARLLSETAESRLQSDLAGRGVRAPRVRAELKSVAHGATPLVLAATVSTADTGPALASMLRAVNDTLERAPDAALACAAHALSTELLLRLDTTTSAADMATEVSVLALPDDHHAAYHRSLSALKTAEVRDVARQYFTPVRAVIVVGDPDRLVQPLSRFGQVNVSDAQSNFRVERVVTRDPGAPLEAP